ncbi:hypothetical protein [Pelobacter propionicus]|uniref:Uncharacterized protein n=1 Tax=Pelobacter propionicus (strain DSM 2379 / NBRC 103807 / OttBd1) TaxID=338966 RepID=A0R838_PELPD|nr:hypothetical protein [Pelobacter propionicus]ABL01338.1 hypothetical protein Ppro_3747 [Pelobacter propionicus DSM 2379]
MSQTEETILDAVRELSGENEIGLSEADCADMAQRCLTNPRFVRKYEGVTLTHDIVKRFLAEDYSSFGSIAAFAGKYRTEDWYQQRFLMVKDLESAFESFCQKDSPPPFVSETSRFYWFLSSVQMLEEYMSWADGNKLLGYITKRNAVRVARFCLEKLAR